MKTATISPSPLRLLAIRILVFCSLASAPAIRAQEERSLYLTANLGRIYERVPKETADQTVRDMLEGAGYSSERDLLVDLGNFSAPTLYDIDGALKIPPPLFVESSYGLGALPKLRRLGLDAAALGPRELMLPAERYRWDTPPLNFVVSNGRRLGLRPYSLTEAPFARIGADLPGAAPLRVGGMLDLDQVKLVPAAARELSAESELAYLQQAQTTRDVVVPHPANRNKDVIDWREPRALLILENHKGWAIDQASAFGGPTVIKMALGSVPSSKTKYVKHDYIPLRRALALAETFAFDGDLAPKTVEDIRYRPARFEVHDFTVDLAAALEEAGMIEPAAISTPTPRRAAFATFIKEFAPEEGEFLLARVERRRVGGHAIENYTFDAGSFLLRRDPQGRWAILLEGDYRLAAPTLRATDLTRILGKNPTVAELHTALAAAPAFADLFDDIRTAIVVLESAYGSLAARRSRAR